MGKVKFNPLLKDGFDLAGNGGGSTNDKGFFPTVLALETAIPVGELGWYAMIGDTDTFWTWDGDTLAWVNTGVGASPAYVNAGVNNIAVGGIGANAGPFNTTMVAMRDRLLYPFQQMTGNLSTNPAFATIREIGNPINSVVLTANFINSLNPRYPVTGVIFRRDGVLINTQLGADLITGINYTDNNPFSTTTVFSAEISSNQPHTITSSRTFTFLYPWFYGKVTGGSKPVKDQALIDAGTKVVGASTGTIIANFNSTASDWLWFAIPATSTSKTRRYIDALNNGNIGGGINLFDTENIVAVDSPGLFWNGINYKIYVSNYQSAVSLPMELRNV